MKPNLEISLKFWIAMTAFFAFWLSLPCQSYLIGNNILNYSNLSGFYFICLIITLLLYMVLALRYSEVKSKLSKEAFFSKVSAQTITDYDNQIKCQESKITELKTAFEDAVVEITELRSKAKVSEDELKIAYGRIEVMKVGLKEYFDLNKNLQNKLSRSKQPRDSHGHFIKVKPVESKYWECISPDYENFKNGSEYLSDSTRNSLDDLLWLFNGESVHPYLVHKKDFKPVQK